MKRHVFALAVALLVYASPVFGQVCQVRTYTETFLAVPPAVSEPSPWGVLSFSSVTTGGAPGASIFFDYPAMASTLEILSFDAYVPQTFVNGVRVVYTGAETFIPYVDGGIQFEGRSQVGVGALAGPYLPGYVGLLMRQRGYWYGSARNVGYPESVYVAMRTTAKVC